MEQYERDVKKHGKNLAKLNLACRLIKSVYWMLLRSRHRLTKNYEIIFLKDYIDISSPVLENSFQNDKQCVLKNLPLRDLMTFFLQPPAHDQLCNLAVVRDAGFDLIRF